MSPRAKSTEDLQAESKALSTDLISIFNNMDIANMDDTELTKRIEELHKFRKLRVVISTRKPTPLKKYILSLSVTKAREILEKLNISI